MTDSPEPLSKISQPSVLQHPDMGTVGVLCSKDQHFLQKTDGFFLPPLFLCTASTSVRESPSPDSLQGSVMLFHPPHYLGVGVDLPSPQIWVKLMSKGLWALS